MRRWLLIVIGCIGIVNFAVFFIGSIYFGGDAVNGYSCKGHYFLGSHGRYTETTKAVYTYSRWHVYSLFITHPAAMLAGIIWSRDKKAALRLRELQSP
jgi:hypothetical protein